MKHAILALIKSRFLKEMSLEKLQREVLAEREKIMKELDKESNANRKKLDTLMKEAHDAIKNSREPKARGRSKTRRIRPTTIRKRHPGANYEIAGRPTHLAPGSILRAVEGSRSHSRTLAVKRGRRATKSK